MIALTITKEIGNHVHIEFCAHTLRLQSSNKANITIVKGKFFATDEDGNGLYSLVLHT